MSGRGVAVILAVLIVACTGSADRPVVAPPSTAPIPSPPATVTSTTEPLVTTTTAVALVPWTGPVEHLFFHTLVVRPDLAFRNDSLGRGFRNYFVTVSEFRAILVQLYANGWTLVDIHRAVAGAVRVPPGRKPLVLSEDDVNYYDYSRPRGLGWRLVLGPGGAIQVEIRDDQGVRVTDDDLVPIVDAFVAAHPDFSAEGAKGVLALTGYEGLFGERIDDPTDPDFAGSQERAAAIAARLKSTGWTLASHSYGHLDLSAVSTARAQRDTERWKEEAVPIVGDTDVYVYPFGGRPSTATITVLADEGFTILCDIDVAPRLRTVAGVTVMSRRHIDGIAFADQARALSPFFDVATVEDTAARGQ